MLKMMISVVAYLAAISAFATSPQEVSLVLRFDPPQLNSMLSTDMTSWFVLGHVMEGLVRYGRSPGVIEPGVAERWKISGKHAIFTLRKDARWTDGKRVTAQDFAFAWLTLLDPKTASHNASDLFIIRGARDYATGKAPRGSVGIRALDERSLEVDFENPCPYFLSLVAAMDFFPLRQDIYEKYGSAYASDPGKMLYNGAFVLKQWTHGASLELEKNPQYWNASHVELEKIHIPFMTSDLIASINLFRNKQVDFVEMLSKEGMAYAQRESLKLSFSTPPILWRVDFNLRPGRPTANRHLRRAIALAFDSQEFIERVVGIPGTLPARGLVARPIHGWKGSFRDENPLPVFTRNLKAAHEELALALKELGLSEAPKLTWLVSDSPQSKIEAEYFQALFKKSLGIDLKIDAQVFKQRIAKRQQGEFDLARVGASVLFDDPLGGLEPLVSSDEDNATHYENPVYDRLIEQAIHAPKAQDHYRFLAKAEKLAMDDLPILPTNEHREVYLVAPRVHGLIKRDIGFVPDLTWARVE